ncbi:MAG: cob(I)yrinic acid a,c-diamide adenosyltransferase [Desulfobacterales bacterium]|jgi:cob(I)alamin adenosyltransferase
MKIYTGSGDRGKTSLFSGERVSKGDLRIEAYGDLDELNSILGALIASLPPQMDDDGESLRRIQSDLFHVGAWLATSSDAPSGQMLQHLEQDAADFLEQAIDRMQEALPPLDGFILPGGHPASAWAHVARTVCRRTERRVVALAERENHAPPLPAVLVYLNRLSDYLFVLARRINHVCRIQDVRWKP